MEGTLSLNILLHLLFYKYCVEKFQVQVSDLEYFFFESWRFEKHIAFSEKKLPLITSILVAESLILHA